jgi:hypothetical protein
MESGVLDDVGRTGIAGVLEAARELSAGETTVGAATPPGRMWNSTTTCCPAATVARASA